MTTDVSETFAAMDSTVVGSPSFSMEAQYTFNMPMGERHHRTLHQG